MSEIPPNSPRPHAPRERFPIQFPTTRWSLLGQAAGDEGSSAQRGALAALLKLYTEPIRAFVAADRRVRPDQVDDVVQDFLSAKWLDQGQQNFLARADPERGRFRGYLVTALSHYLSNWLRSQRRAERAGSLDPKLMDVPAAGGGPEALFDLAWARQVVYAAVERMRAECEHSGRPDVWGVFEARILGPKLYSAPVPGYGELIARFGFKSPMHASNVLMTAKRTFVRALREVIAEYEEGGDIDAEVADLKQILSESGR